MKSKDRYGNNLVLRGQNWAGFKSARIYWWNLRPDPLPWALGFLALQERDGSLPLRHSSLQILLFLDITSCVGTPQQAEQSLQRCWPRTEIQQTAQYPCLNKSHELPGANIQRKQVSLIPLKSASSLCLR